MGLGKAVTSVGQGFSTALPGHTDVLQALLKHATPDYLVRGTNFFSLRLSIKK